MIQGKLEDEIRKRADVIKQKKKTESQIQDLESQIVGQNKYLADLNKELILQTISSIEYGFAYEMFASKPRTFN